MHERPTQDTWTNLVVKSPTTRQNPAKMSVIEVSQVCQSRGHTKSPPPDRLPLNVNRLGRPIVTSQRTVVQNTNVFFVQRYIVSCFKHKVI